MLTSKHQETFSQAIADGESQVDAYKLSYDCSNWSLNAINVQASRMMDNPKIILRVQELRQTVVDATVASKAWDLDKIVDELAVNVSGARLDKQWSASTTAVMGIGKAIGLISDKVDVNVTHTLKPGLSLEELEARYQRLEVLEAGIVDGEVIDGNNS